MMTLRRRPSGVRKMPSAAGRSPAAGGGVSTGTAGGGAWAEAPADNPGEVRDAPLDRTHAPRPIAAVSTIAAR